MNKAISQKCYYLPALLWLLASLQLAAQKLAIYQEAAANYTNIRAIEPFPYPIGERDDVGNEANVGFVVGFVAKILMNNERLSFPVGIHFQRKGFHVTPAGPVFVVGENGNLIALQTDRIGYRFDYLTLTPSAEYMVLKDKLGLSLGPYISLRAKEAVKIFDHTGWEDDDGDTFVEKTDFGLQAGVHAYWKRFGLFGKYQYGLRQNKKFATVDENFAPTGFLYFRNTAVVLGVSFRLTGG